MSAYRQLCRFVHDTLAGGRDYVCHGNRSSLKLRKSMRCSPLIIADKTYNAAHPDYDAQVVRNFPYAILNTQMPCDNALYQEFRALAKDNNIPANVWKPILKEALAEVQSVPGYHQVMERKHYIHEYMERMCRTYKAHYVSGWVSMNDALFLYWVVRRFKPKVVVQTGVSNGMSSAFITMALAQNGGEGILHLIDLPAIVNPADPAWTVKDKIYGVAIPEGKSSGWMVPDIYRNRVTIREGDARKLLPELVDSLDSIDMFYHDSDHSYDHMKFEFEEVKRKMAPGGIVLADDIGWNASLWEFADQCAAPAYNLRGSVGIVFL